MYNNVTTVENVNPGKNESVIDQRCAVKCCVKSSTRTSSSSSSTACRPFLKRLWNVDRFIISSLQVSADTAQLDRSHFAALTFLSDTQDVAAQEQLWIRDYDG
jgi:hypothetical protein